MIRPHQWALLALLLSLLPLGLLAQRMQGIGLRFASDFNYFTTNNGQVPLVTGWFSNIVVGPFYKAYGKGGGIETGINFCYKEPNDGFSLPLVMRDLNDGQRTSIMALEAEFLCGPRLFKYFFPKFGLIAGYRFKGGGFVQDQAAADYSVNNFYLTLPVGFSLDLPTGFGSTGVALYYDIGLTNVLSGLGLEGGGKQRAINFEIHVMLAFDK